MRSGNTGLQTWSLGQRGLGSLPARSTYLSLSPICHFLQGQVRPVDGCGRPPYRQSEQDNDSPKGDDGCAS